MSLASETAIRAAIKNTLEGVSGIGNVYSRVRRPLQGTDAQYKALYADDSGFVNVWMIRRVQRLPRVDEFNTVVAVTLVYQLLAHYSLRDVKDNLEDESTASENVFQQLIENVAASFEADAGIGIDGVTNRGLAVPTDIEDRMLGSYLCHYAECRLIVDVEDC